MRILGMMIEIGAELTSDLVRLFGEFRLSMGSQLAAQILKQSFHSPSIHIPGVGGGIDEAQAGANVLTFIRGRSRLVVAIHLHRRSEGGELGPNPIPELRA
jgi:hypothetical protein